jgi:Arc-like DNA binding domain
MPQELRQALADAAARSGRSLNAELVDRLERSLGRSAQHRAKDVFASAIRRGSSMTIRRRHRLLLGTLVIPAAVLAALMLAFSGSTGRAGDKTIKGGKFALSGGDPDATSATKPGLGVDAAEAYLSAERTYPANVIPTSVVQNAEATFNKISGQNDPRGLAGKFGHWDQYGPRENAIQPGVLSFSGATTPTASRITALVISPKCTPGQCRLWAGVAGGGVWRTNNALAPNPKWQWLTPELAQNSVGALILDPTDPSGNTLYLGTGEANRCSSGCEAGVGIYKSTDGGEHWSALADSCVSNARFTCASPGKDAFLGRAISGIVVDPTDPSHLIVGSALAVRGLSHVISAGSTKRLEPDANEPGVYESFNGGATFTEVWDGAKPDPGPLDGQPGPLSFGVTQVALDPLDPKTVYASGFDAGLWRRSPALDGAADQFDFRQVFQPRKLPPFCTPNAVSGCGFIGDDRTSFAPTVKNGKTRLYLLDGTANGAGSTSDTAMNFWRTDNANQPAATLLASEAAGSTVPAATTVGPQVYNGWQVLSSNSTASPYYATIDACTGQCWYDEVVYTPQGMPDTVYVLGSYNYNELPCNTKGVACNAGRSNARGVVYSTTAGDPEPTTTADGTSTTRTFTDLTFDGQNQPANWCALGSAEFDIGGVTAPFQCLWAPDNIHPDQHAIVVNPSNPTQIFEGSDGGIIRTNGAFDDISQHCQPGERPLLGAASRNNCKRLLSRVPDLTEHIDRNLSSTIQFINVAINPANSCEVMGGTQDNGTWSNNNPSCANQTFPQIIYGDGGNAVYDATQPTWRANEFTSGASDSNFENGDPTKWVITSAPVVNSGEAIGFYWPQIGDPNPTPGAHPIYSGAQHVWRSWAMGAGHRAVPQDKTPDISFYENNCQEFTVAFNTPTCGDYQPLGGPYCEAPPAAPATPTFPACPNEPGDLTGTVYGTDRQGGSISWLARDEVDHGTLWATTSAGRIFVTHNADAADPASVTWHRIDNSSSPTRFPSGIYPDPAHPSHAWISYSGYNAVTPATPGHVFSVDEGNPATPGSGVFTNLNIESGTSTFPTPTDDGDLPVSDIVRDDATHTLFASTDFGVLAGKNDGTGGWFVTKGLPRFEVMHLAIEPSAREATCTSGKKCQHVLYAATHSQGIWKLKLKG